MKKTIAIFDVDKTMFPGYSIIDFAEYLARSNHFKNEGWKEFTRLIGEYIRGVFEYNDFAVLIVDSYARGVVGQSADELSNLSKLFWVERIETIYGYVKPLIKNLNKLNAEIIVVSGSTNESLWPMLQNLGISRYYCTEVEVINGEFLSKVKTNVASHGGKAKVIKKIFEKLDSNDFIYGFGDSVADLSFLELVNMPVVIGNHDKELEEVARREGWRVLLEPDTERVKL